jgi:isoquinoline 1-oxidoreductase
MLYARLLRPPMHGATLLHVDTSALEQLTGVTLVNENELVAVLHAHPEAAAAALSRIKAQWTLPAKTLNPENIHQHLREQLTEMKLLVNQGELPESHNKAMQLIESNYTKGYVAHAPMEPHAALADYKNGKITIWASTQTPFPTRDRVAGLLDLPQKNVRVITPFLGGGFGGKSADQQVMEAARLTRITGHPVQVAWTREEEFFYDRFDPASTVNVISGTDQNGKIVAWDYTVYAAGDRGAIPSYSLPNCRVRSAGQSLYENAPVKTGVHLFGTGPWRGPGANMNVFAIESQMDIMAAELKTDALTFRLNNLTDARMARLFKVAADRFGWFNSARFRGQGYGLACNIDAGTYVVCMAEVSVDATSGNVSVHRVVCAQDMGIVINPDGARMQIEGGITMGLGYTLSEEIQFDGGEILDNNFNTYSIPRFSWVPKIDVVLVKNDALAPQGGGEPAITVTGAVIANAIFDATGVRLFQLPMTPKRIREALAAQQKT